MTMTESERLTEKRDGQNVIPLRQDGKTKWALTSAGMGNASTQFLYGTHADKLADYEAIGTVEEFKALKEKNEPKKMLHNGVNWYRCPNGCEIHKKQFEKDWYCPKCGQKLDWKGKGE